MLESGVTSGNLADQFRIMHPSVWITIKSCIFYTTKEGKTKCNLTKQER